jgi:integrase
MKMEREHVVPLSARCLHILEQARVVSKDHELIFPDSDSSLVMSENRFLVARDALGYGKDRCTPHGFRSSFRDWAAEETNFPSEVVEMALAHAIANKTEAAYRRGQLLSKRLALMEAWAAFACPAATVDSIGGA